jgi:hypothetical protein
MFTAPCAGMVNFRNRAAQVRILNAIFLGERGPAAGKNSLCHEQQADDLREVLQLVMRTVENSPVEKKAP